MKKFYSITVLLIMIATMSCCEKDPEPEPTNVKVGDVYQGGYVVKTKTETTPGLISANVPLTVDGKTTMDWYKATAACTNYKKDGYTWRMATLDEMKIVWEKLPIEIKSQGPANYWTSTQATDAMTVYFYPYGSGNGYTVKTSALSGVIPIHEY